MLFILTDIRKERELYDVVKSYLIRAKTETQARLIAYETKGGDEPNSIWTNDKETSCKLIKPNGKSEILMIDFNAG